MNVTTRTYVYKAAGGCEIKADVHRAADDVMRPALVWIHGGALIIGHRRNLSDRQRDLYLKAGYAVVSIDYRLAPETKLPAIIEDIQDAFRWVREKGPGLFRIDPVRIAAIGSSGGGYLALMAGMCVEPRPRAVVSFYGYGDIVGEWYSRPDPFYRRLPLVSKEEASKAVGGAVISGAEGPHHRDRFYLYCRQQGLWPQEVTGHDPDAEPKWFEAYCPDRNVTPDYPPTMLLHGTADTDVPYRLSAAMADALARAGIPHEFVTAAGGPHGFDGADTPEVATIFDRVLAFLGRYVG
jgi:acetyl esterase/lipase